MILCSHDFVPLLFIYSQSLQAILFFFLSLSLSLMMLLCECECLVSSNEMMLLFMVIMVMYHKWGIFLRWFMLKKKGLKLLMNGVRAKKLVGKWSFGLAAWVFSMVVLGGLTRLTWSGLSVTDWKFINTLYPFSDEECLQGFDKYKQPPENKR